MLGVLCDTARHVADYMEIRSGKLLWVFEARNFLVLKIKILVNGSNYPLLNGKLFTENYSS